MSTIVTSTKPVVNSEWDRLSQLMLMSPYPPQITRTTAPFSLLYGPWSVLAGM